MEFLLQIRHQMIAFNLSGFLNVWFYKSIKSLFSDNFLWLKVDKAEVLICVPARFKSGFALFYIKTTFRNLGEKLHGGTVTLFCISKNCFCSVFISWEKSVKSHLDIFVQAFISSHLGCCNSVFAWLSNPALHHLQLLKNAAANISCLTSLLISLNQLPTK